MHLRKIILRILWIMTNGGVRVLQTLRTARYPRVWVLWELKQRPEGALIANCKAFPSEDRLYGTEKLINRLNSSETKKASVQS